MLFMHVLILFTFNAWMYVYRYLPTARRRHKRINQVLVTGEFSIFEYSKSKIRKYLSTQPFSFNP